MSDIRKFLDIVVESSAGASTAGAVATVSQPLGSTHKRVEEDDKSNMPEVLEYGNWENSALTTSSKLKKERRKAAKVVKSIYGEDKKAVDKEDVAESKKTKKLVVEDSKTPEYYEKLARKHTADGQKGTRANMVYASKMAGRARRAAEILRKGGTQENALQHYQGTDKDQGVAEDAEINESAYNAGVQDGLSGQRNRRASSVYGPEVGEYDRGYAAGLKQAKEKGQQGDNVPPFADIPSDVLRRSLKASVKRLQEIQDEVDELTRDNFRLPSYEKKRMPPELKAEVNALQTKIQKIEDALKHRDQSKNIDEGNRLLAATRRPSTGNFPEPRMPTELEKRGTMAKNLTIGQDGLVYHWQDPRAKMPAKKLEEMDLILNPASISKRNTDLVSKSNIRTDHEVEMAKSDLYQASKNAAEIFKMIRNVSEEQGLEGWVQEKIIKAADYLNTVREYMEGKCVTDEGITGAIAGGVAGAALTKTPTGARIGAELGSELQDMVSNESIDGVSPSTKMFTSETSMDEGKTGPGLWANIRKRKASGKRMRKPGEEGAPTDAALKAARHGSK